ncbi:ALP1-like protein isoform X1 [Tanacetum coccineum]
MNQNNEDRQLSVFEIDANDDETDVVFLEQAYTYHQQLVAEENHLPLTRNPINRDREGAEERLMADYFNDHCRVQPDATGRMSLSVIMKCTTAIRQLAYGTTPDAFDEYLQMISWQRQYGRGIKKYPAIMLEVVASQDLWIWHAFFGVTGANNDINVLDNSPLFDDLLDDKALVALERKDVGRAFGVLQGRCGIIQQPARQYHVNTIRRIMYSCIIMHNMILEYQKMAVFDWKEVYVNPSRNMQCTWVERCETQRRKNKELRDREMHLSLQQNLMKHIWQQVDHEDEDF